MRAPAPASPWRDARLRRALAQGLVLAGLAAGAWALGRNMAEALRDQGVASGFAFLGQESAFAIDDALLPYTAEDTFGRALLVGLVNTLVVSLVGNALAVCLGTCLGVARLSRNRLAAGASRIYVDVARNVPLLLQLFFWYTLVTELAPPVREALEPLPHVFVSQRGVAVPVPVAAPVHAWMVPALLAGLALLAVLWRRGGARRRETGRSPPALWAALALPAVLPLAVWAAWGAPADLDVPRLEGFNFRGGLVLSTEFFALLAGLVFYTSAFVAEIVRCGIQSVDRGQWEAARSVGLSPPQVLALVVLPQALRVVVPPLTSQMLNLTKNSSLAVAIGYPDLVNVANTTSNQTGQAVECIAVVMLIYLSFSLATSLFMNWYNHATRLVGR